jgi:hypothetical protein
MMPPPKAQMATFHRSKTVHLRSTYNGPALTFMQIRKLCVVQGAGLYKAMLLGLYVS